MPFVQAQCPSCGGMLAVDNNHKSATCQFCDSTFIVEEAVNNFISYNTTNQHFAAGSIINFYNKNSENDFIIEAGVLKRYKGASVDVIIPEGVTHISSDCFQGLHIKSIITPRSLISIESEAFKNCVHLVSITINSDTMTTIECNTFEGCTSLITVTLPNSITEIDSSAFSYCTSLTTITLPNNITEINSSTFAYCGSLKSIIIPKNVKSIRHSAFEGCTSLASIVIPKSVEHIGLWAFYDCTALVSVKFENVNIETRFIESFKNTQYYNNNPVILKNKFRSLGRCQYCGGELKGLITKKCKKCGKQKDY